MSDDSPILCTVEEARAELRLSKGAVYALIKTGELQSLSIGRARRIPRESIRRLVAERLGGES